MEKDNKLSVFLFFWITCGIVVFIIGVLFSKKSKVAEGEKMSTEHSFKVGTKYVIRTVTMHYVGMLKDVTETDLVLSDASWLPVQPRWNTFLKEGTQDEVEPFVDDVIICRGGIIDATEWRHDLPREQK